MSSDFSPFPQGPPIIHRDEPPTPDTPAQEPERPPEETDEPLPEADELDEETDDDSD